MTMKSDSSAKIRSRDGWVRVREIPAMTSALSSESTAVHCGDVNNGETEQSSSPVMSNTPEGTKRILNRRKTPRYQYGDDQRQDDIESRKMSQDQWGRIDSPGDEIGFEVEMRLAGSSSTNDITDSGELGMRGTLCSDGSRLDFPLDQLSGSAVSIAYANFQATNNRGRSIIEECNAQKNPETQGLAIMNAIEQSLLDSQNLKRNKTLFVDVNAEPARRGTGDRKDETPVTNNRSQRNNEKTPNFSPSPASMMSLKSKKKEGVANTLATVFQEIDSPDDEGSSSLSSGEVNDDSSADVDVRWEKLQAKYNVESKSSLPTSLVSYSDDPNDEDMRDTLLDVNSCQSPRIYLSGSSETFEDELIQDCIDTGLPSPTKRKAADAERHTISEESSQSSSTTPTLGNTSPKECTAKDLLKAARSGSLYSSSGDDGPSKESKCSKNESTTKSNNEFSSKYENEINRSRTELVRKHPSNEITKEDKETSHRPNVENESRNPILRCRSDEDMPTPKIEISLMPSESSANSEPISDMSESSVAEQENCDAKPFEENAQHRQENEIFLQSGKGLSWWRKNGRNLVNEKLQEASVLRTKGSAKSSQNTDQGSGDHTSQIDKLCSKNNLTSASDGAPSGKKEGESAFKRGMSIFANKTKSVPGPSPFRKSSRHQAQASTGTNTIPLNHDQQSNKSTHAPQPNPDADSSNSVGNERKPSRTVLGMQSATVSTEKDVISTPMNGGSPGQNRLSRPRHEDSEAGGAIGLAPSPKGPRDSSVRVPSVLEGSSRGETPRSRQAGTEGERILTAAATITDNRNLISYPDSTEDFGQKKMILSVKKRFFETGGGVLTSQSATDESEYTADILNVASTLTGETSSVQQPKEKSKKTETSFPPRESGFDKQKKESTGLGVGNKNIPTMDPNLNPPIAEVLSWRMPPEESLSDFTIQLHHKRSNALESYHVHKHIVGVGPRRSEVLGGIFRSTKTASAKITLIDESLAYVPSVFDFAYCHDLELYLTTGNVMAYRYLAGIFQISPIIKQTAEFLLQDIEIENISTYISESSRYDDDTVKKMIAAICAERIQEIEISDVLWTVMDPALFLRVLSCPKIDRKKASRELSVLLAEYHALHQYEVDVTMFLEMSSVSILPLIDRRAAIPLLEICEDYGTPTSLQSLQKRCAQVVAYHWKTTSDMDRRRLFALLRSLPSNFTVDFLEVVETGNGSALFDPAVSKVLKNSNHTANFDGYEDAASFTLEKLCGKHERNRSYLKGDIDRPLTWRMDPDRSFSDWMIKVKHKHDGKVDSYHVHKHMLSIGYCSSTFFAETFLSEDHKNLTRGSTTMELSEEPAELIPVVFDFIYSPEHDLEVTSRTALALRFLSRVFGIWMLNKKVIEYVENDMDFTNLLLYLEQAEIYDDERIKNIAVQKCAIGIRGIDAESEILHGIKPDFLGRVVASSEIDKSASCHVNILIAKYFTLHDLKESLLAELMKQVPMKDMDLESALKLLDVMSSVKSKGVSIFEEIRQRCTELLMDNWKTVRDEHRDLTFRILQTLDASLVTAIFNVVENEYYDELIETMSVQSRLVKRYRAKLEEAETLRKEDIAKMKEEHELVVVELLNKQNALEAELTGYHDATSRRALRSSGHTRIPSPRLSSSGSGTPRQSYIPRLNGTRADMSPSPAASDKPTQPQMKTPRNLEGPSRRTPKVTAPCEQQGSMFGSWFGCRPENPSDEEVMDSMGAMTKAMPSAKQHHLAETSGKTYY